MSCPQQERVGSGQPRTPRTARPDVAPAGAGSRERTMPTSPRRRQTPAPRAAPQWTPGTAWPLSAPGRPVPLPAASPAPARPARSSAPGGGSPAGRARGRPTRRARRSATGRPGPGATARGRLLGRRAGRGLRHVRDAPDGRRSWQGPVRQPGGWTPLSQPRTPVSIASIRNRRRRMGVTVPSRPQRLRGRSSNVAGSCCSVARLTFCVPQEQRRGCQQHCQQARPADWGVAACRSSSNTMRMVEGGRSVPCLAASAHHAQQTPQAFRVLPILGNAGRPLLLYDRPLPCPHLCRTHSSPTTPVRPPAPPWTLAPAPAAAPLPPSRSPPAPSLGPPAPGPPTEPLCSCWGGPAAARLAAGTASPSSMRQAKELDSTDHTTTPPSLSPEASLRTSTRTCVRERCRARHVCMLERFGAVKCGIQEHGSGHTGNKFNAGGPALEDTTFACDLALQQGCMNTHARVCMLVCNVCMPACVHGSVCVSMPVRACQQMRSWA